MSLVNSYQSRVSSLNPSIWFRFDETSGTPINSGSLSCSLTTFGTPVLNQPTGVDGRSVDLSSGYYQLSNFPDFSLFNDKSFTVEAWFKMPTKTDTVWPTIFSFGTPGYSGQFIFARVLGTNSSQVGRIDVGFVPASGYNEYKCYSNKRIDDNKWHHMAVTVNTTSMKLYVDGALSSSASITTPASINFDGSATEKFFGTNTPGLFDEFAIYDRELTSGEINNNYTAGAYVLYAGDPTITATATMVQPALAASKQITVSPMTASTLFVNTNASNFNFVTHLNSKMASLNLEQYFLFDTDIIENSGYSGYVETIKSYEPEFGFIGPAGAFAARIGNSYDKGLITFNNATDPINDGNYSIGVWFKLASDATDDTKRVFFIPGQVGGRIGISIEAGNPYFFAQTKNGSTIYQNDHTVSQDVRDGQWHYAAMTLSGTTISYYLDGTQVHTSTRTGSRFGAAGFWRIGGSDVFDNTNDTGYMYVSSPYITSTAEVSGTQISNIWTVGSGISVQAEATFVQPVVEFKNQYNAKNQDLGAIYDLRFDESAVPLINYGSLTPDSISQIDANIERQVETQNHFAYKFPDGQSIIELDYSVDLSYANSHNLVANMGTLDTDEVNYTYISTTLGGNTDGLGEGSFVIGADQNGPFAALITDPLDAANWDYIHSESTDFFDSFHMYTVTSDATNWKFYIDGKLIGTSTVSVGYSEFGGAIIIGGAGQYLSLDVPWDTSTNIQTSVDEFTMFDYELNAQEVFELYRSLNIQQDGAEAELVNPSLIAGTGAAITPNAITASVVVVNPSHLHETAPTILPMNVFATLLMPNYGTEVLLTVNYGSSPMEASALVRMPEGKIGEVDLALPMEASATFVNPEIVLPGKATVNPLIALDAKFVTPGVVTILGARVNAYPMVANSRMVIPPNLKSNFDDLWYSLLYKQHSIPNGQRNAFGGNLPNTTGSPSAQQFLKLFDDVTQDITIGSGRSLKNNISYQMEQDNPNALTPNDWTEPTVVSGGDKSFLPSPLLSIGTSDDYGRKAVRVRNIQFNTGQWNLTSIGNYSLEFSIKTTKANQVIAQGSWASYQYYGTNRSGIGLYNGKLYGVDTYPSGNTPHPLSIGTDGAVVGNKRIDDGQWHHIVIQYDNNPNSIGGNQRTQIWIDGVLDVQSLTKTGPKVRQYVLGFNSSNELYSSDFETSVWSYDGGMIVANGEVYKHYLAYTNSVPIEVEPMLASATETTGTTARGNRGRALMLYWEPVLPGRATNFGGIDKSIDELPFTIDWFQSPPQTWYDWDVFPVDINGYYASELVNPSSYGGLALQDLGGTISQSQQKPFAQFLVNTNGYFRDPVTDDRRYIDLVNDIDLSQFDVIFFKNYPTTPDDLKRTTTNEIVDSYFGNIEKELYEKFLQGLRAAVDTGIGLYITNEQLAIDLGIVDRVDFVSNLKEVGNTPDQFSEDGGLGDPWALARLEETIGHTYEAGYLNDTYYNNRHRIINTLTGFTDIPSWILTEQISYVNLDVRDFGGPNRYWAHIENRPNGLQIGDEFIFGESGAAGAGMAATPIENVKAGKVLTTFAQQYRRGDVLTDNPYANYATSIVLQPGDVLNGKQIGGKIFVDFTELIKDGAEAAYVELTTTSILNAALADGAITQAEYDEYVVSKDNLNVQLSEGTITQDQFNSLSYWTTNGDNIEGGVQYITGPTKTTITSTASGKISIKTKSLTKLGKGRKAGMGTAGIPLFTVQYGYTKPMATVQLLTINERAWIWLSEKVVDGVVPQRPLAIESSATMIQPTVIADKDTVLNAQAMLSGVKIVELSQYNNPNITLGSLPMIAFAEIVLIGKNVAAQPMVSTARATSDNKAANYIVDEVILYVHSVDPILYLREDVIK
jgi:hypothetical protein